MVRIFIDTNIMLDYLLDREGSEQAERILELSQFPEYSVMMSSLSMSNIAYIMRHVFKGAALYEELELIRELVKLTTVNEQNVDDAIRLRAADFEDALQYTSAKAAGADVIITNNIKHFKFDDIKVQTSEDFLKEL